MKSCAHDYQGKLGLILPLLVCSIVGTMLGTWILDRWDEELFRKIFRVALAVLAARLVVSPWI